MRIEGSGAIFHPNSQMRVRITKALKGSVDGIQLSRLAQGQVYDVNTSLACYLLSEEMAEPANGETYAAVAAEKKTVTTVPPRSLAADHRRIKAAPSKRKEHS
jgi:hypothetical protein